MRGSGPTLRKAVWVLAVLALWVSAARAEEGSEAKPAGATKSIPTREMGLWAEAHVAALQGWLPDFQAEVEGVSLVAWLARLDSARGEEVAEARRVFMGLGRRAYPWIAVGLGSGQRPTLQAPCSELAAELTTAAEEDLTALATAVSPWTRRVALAAGRRAGLSEEARRDALGDDDPVVRRQAAIGFLLGASVKPESLAAIEAALADEDPGTRAAAALVLLRAGGPAATRFAASLERPEVRARYPSTSLLGLPAEAGDAVLPLFASPSWHVRSHAAALLAFAETISPRAVAALAAALGDQSAGVRWRAACALDRPEARGAEVALRARLSDAAPEVAAAAAVALATLGSIDEAAVAPLVAALVITQPSPWAGQGFLVDQYGRNWFLLTGSSLPIERLAAALGRHGAAGVAAVRAAAKSDAARRNAVAVYDAAGKAGDEALRASVVDSDDAVRRAAALALARRGDARTEVVTTLAHQVGWGPWVDGRNERLDALLSLGPAALPALRTLLAKADYDLRPGLVAALVALGPRAAPAVPELLRAPLDAIETLPGEKESSTSLFEKAIRAIGAPALDGLVAGIASDDPAVRERAFRGCLYLGPLAKPALPALRAALEAKRIPGYEDVPAGDPIHPIE